MKRKTSSLFQEMGVLVWELPEKRVMVVTKDGHDAVKRFWKRQRQTWSSGSSHRQQFYTHCLSLGPVACPCFSPLVYVLFVEKRMCVCVRERERVCVCVCVCVCETYRLRERESWADLSVVNARGLIVRCFGYSRDLATGKVYFCEGSTSTTRCAVHTEIEVIDQTCYLIMF